jgi:hypothetical protein
MLSVFPSDLPGVNPATLNEMLLYYRVMTKRSGLGDSAELSRVGLSQKTPQGVSEEKFNAVNNLFRGAIISVLVDNLVDTYLQRKTGKDIWESLEAQHGASDADVELYVMEQFLHYRMVEDHFVVEHAHEVQALAKELENYSKEVPCVLPNKFVAGAIITKLPHSWRDFAASLKHKRKEFTFDDLIVTLDVEEKARAKNTRGKTIAAPSSANFV